MSQLFAWGGQSTGFSALASFLPRNTQDWSPSEWTGWISLQSKGLSRVFSNTTVQKHQFFSTLLSSQSNSHIHTWPLEKPVYADANYLRLPFENHWNTYSLNLSFTHNWEFFSCIISRIVSVPKSCKDWKPLLSWILPKNLGYLLIRSTSYFWYQFLQTYLSHITMGNEFCLFSVPQYHSTTGAPYISVGWTNMGLQHCQVLRINVAAFHNWNRTLSVLVCSFTIMWQWKKLQTGIGQNHLFPGKHKPCPTACA